MLTSGFSVSHPWDSGIEVFKNIILSSPGRGLTNYTKEKGLNIADIVQDMVDYMYSVCGIEVQDTGDCIFSTTADNSKLKIKRDYIEHFNNNHVPKIPILTVYRPDTANPGLSYLGQYPLPGSIMFGNGSADKNAPSINVLEGWVVDSFNGDKIVEITDSNWRVSTQVTVRAIQEYIRSPEVPTDKSAYKAARVEKGTKIQNLFNEVISKLAGYYGHSNRNSYNPSDIFVYRKDKENQICSDLEKILEYIQKEEEDKFRDLYLKLTAVNFDIIGISLKKLGKGARNSQNVLDLIKEKNYNPEHRTNIEIKDITVKDGNPNSIHFEGAISLVSPYGNRGYNGDYEVKLTFRNYGAKQIDKKILIQNPDAINGKVQLGGEIVFKGMAAISGKIRIGLIRDILGPGVIDKGFENNIKHISDAISIISNNRSKIMQSDNFKAIIKAGLHEEDSSLPFIEIS